MGCVYFSLKTFEDEIKSLSRNKIIALVYDFIATPSYIEQIRSRTGKAKIYFYSTFWNVKIYRLSINL